MLTANTVSSVFCHFYVRDGTPTPEGASHEVTGMKGTRIPVTWKSHRVRVKVPGFKSAFPSGRPERRLSSHSQCSQPVLTPLPHCPRWRRTACGGLCFSFVFIIPRYFFKEALFFIRSTNQSPLHGESKPPLCGLTCAGMTHGRSR